MNRVVLLLAALFCLLMLKCAEEPAPEPAPAKPKPLMQSAGNDHSDLETVCDCFNRAIGLIEEATALREQFSTEEAYLADSAATREIAKKVKTWREVQQHCLQSFGTKLFRNDECDRADELQEKRDKLKALGIST